MFKLTFITGEKLHTVCSPDFWALHKLARVMPTARMWDKEGKLCG